MPRQTDPSSVAYSSAHSAAQSTPHLKPQLTRGQEARRLMIIAAPLMAAYIADLAMFITTKLVVGELGVTELAAVGLAGSLTFEATFIIAGFLSVTAVLVAQAEGGGRKAEAGHSMRQGLIAAILVSAPLSLLVWNLGGVMSATGQDEAVIAAARPFAHWMTGFVLPFFLFVVVRDFVAALSRTWAVMAISFMAVPVNWVLANGFVHGRFGLPEMGAAGAGLSLSIVMWLMFFALIAYVWFTPGLRGYGVFRGRLRFDRSVLAEIFRLGLPIAGLVAVEAGMFTVVGLLSGVISAEMLAAHQILMAWIGVPFVLAAAIAEGTMVRVAHGVGRDDPAGARQAGIVGLALGSGLLILLVVLPLTLAEEITLIFIPADYPDHEAVASLVIQIMVIAAVFQVFDGAQVIMARSLRAVKDAFLPLWLGAFGYWVLGIGGGVLLAFPMGWGGAGLWTGLAIGLTATACLLTWRFLSLTGRIVRGARAARAASQTSQAAKARPAAVS